MAVVADESGPPATRCACVGLSGRSTSGNGAPSSSRELHRPGCANRDPRAPATPTLPPRPASSHPLPPDAPHRRATPAMVIASTPRLPPLEHRAQRRGVGPASPRLSRPPGRLDAPANPHPTVPGNRRARAGRASGGDRPASVDSRPRTASQRGTTVPRRLHAPLHGRFARGRRPSLGRETAGQRACNGRGRAPRPRSDVESSACQGVCPSFCGGDGP